ncbi:MAG: helix-turn-helix domain-containing protein, partial [Deltaproteobacteria bacterium]|nr:helix-turn-helix domain-containing protein [Deltaproteobacteria bacterium]
MTGCNQPYQEEESEIRQVDINIGERLRTIREMYGFSQRALAKRADVTNGIISMIEQNSSSPSIATLKKI